MAASAYVTEAQAVAIYGSGYITAVFDADNDGAIDSAELANAALVATRQIDGYLLGRYTLPLEYEPEILQKLCTDIMVYNYGSHGVRSELHRERYTDAIAYLEKVATGRIKLQVSDPNTTAANLNQSSSVDTQQTIAVVAGDARRFDRGKLKGLM